MYIAQAQAHTYIVQHALSNTLPRKNGSGVSSDQGHIDLMDLYIGLERGGGGGGGGL